MAVRPKTILEQVTHLTELHNKALRQLSKQYETELAVIQDACVHAWRQHPMKSEGYFCAHCRLHRKTGGL